MIPAKLTIEIKTKTAPHAKRKGGFAPIFKVPFEAPSAITKGSY